MLLLVSCSNNSPHSLPSYTIFNELPANYSLEDAKTNGCVVFENLSLTSGEAEWNNFLQITQKCEAATICFAMYYSKNEDSPILYFIDLSFNGSTYSIIEKDGSTKQFKYLNHYTKDAGADANFSRLDYYILVNDKNVSFDRLEKALISSNSADYIEQYRIYTNKIQ